MTKKEDVRQFGLIGRNIDYSFSRRYFAEKFEREQLPNCRYDNFDLKEIDQVTAILNGAQKIAGLNVTIPYKKAIIPFLDHISPEAKQINAVNTICRRNEGWVGYNTDCYGFERSLEAILREPICFTSRSHSSFLFRNWLYQENMARSVSSVCLQNFRSFA